MIIPPELEALKNHRLWGLFDIDPDTHKKSPIQVIVGEVYPGGRAPIPRYQSCTDESTLYTFDEAVAYKNDNNCLSVSLPLASHYIGRILRVVDLDVYKDTFPKENLEEYLKTETYIDKSISGQGYHLWFSFNVAPENPKKISGIDHVGGFVTLGGEVVKQLPIHCQNLTPAELEAGDKETSLSLLNGNCLSVAYIFNCTHPLEEVLLHYGYTPKGANKWLSPNSETGVAGVKVFPSYTNPYNLCFSFHGSDEELTGRAVDAFELVTQYQYGGDKKQATKDQSKILKAINPANGSIWNCSVHDFNINKPVNMAVDVCDHDINTEDIVESYSHDITPLPESILAPDDFYGELVHTYLKSMFKENLMTAHIAASGTISHAMGGKFCGNTKKDRVNIYALATGESGCGKEILRSGPKECVNQLVSMGLINQSNDEQLVTKFGSAESIDEKFIRLGIRPDILYLWDEMGIGMKDAALKRSTVHGAVMADALTRWSASHAKTLARTLVANESTKAYYAPHLTIIGSGTEESVVDAMTSEFVSYGHAARYLFCPGELYAQKSKRHGAEDLTISPNLGNQLAELFNAQLQDIARVNDPFRVTWGEDVSDYLYEITNHIDELPKGLLKNISNRKIVNIKKIMMQRAAINGEPKVDIKYAAWANTIVDHSITYLVSLSTGALSESSFDAAIKAVIRRLEKTPDKWLPAKVFHDLYAMKKLSGHERKAVLGMIESDYRKAELTEKKNARGLPTKLYRYIDD